MPLYEYSCETCQKVFEVTQSIKDAPLDRCPDCGHQVKKLMSLGGFALKGQGWYTTDYKGKSSGSSSSGASGGSSAS